MVPKLFPCGHTLCWGCAEEHHHRTRTSNAPFGCPSCRQPATADSAAGLANNLALIEAIDAACQSNVSGASDNASGAYFVICESVVCHNCDKAAAVLFCNTCCSSLCEQCKDEVHAIKSLRSHTFVPVGSRPLQCAQHNEQIKLFCTTDNTLLCLMCIMVGPHKDHAVEGVERAAGRMRGDLHATEADLEKWQLQLKTAQQLLQTTEEAIAKGTAQSIAEIGAQCDGVVRMVRERQQQLETRAQEAQEAKAQVVRGRKEQVARAAGLVEETLARVRETTGIAGDAALVQAHMGTGAQAALDAARGAPTEGGVEPKLWMRLDDSVLQEDVAAFGVVGERVPEVQVPWTQDIKARGTAVGWGMDGYVGYEARPHRPWVASRRDGGDGDCDGDADGDWGGARGASASATAGAGEAPRVVTTSGHMRAMLAHQYQLDVRDDGSMGSDNLGNNEMSCEDENKALRTQLLEMRMQEAQRVHAEVARFAAVEGTGSMKKLKDAITAMTKRRVSSAEDKNVDVQKFIMLACGGTLPEGIELARLLFKGDLEKPFAGMSNTTWKTMWTVLDLQTKAITFYTDKRMFKTHAKGVLNLQEITKVTLPDTKEAQESHSFLINTGKRVTHLRAPSKAHMDLWIQMLAAVTGSLFADCST